MPKITSRPEPPAGWMPAHGQLVRVWRPPPAGSFLGPVAGAPMARLAFVGAPWTVRVRRPDGRELWYSGSVIRPATPEETARYQLASLGAEDAL